MKITQSQLLVLGQFILFAILAIAFLIFPMGGSSILQAVGFVLAVGGLTVIVLAVYEHNRVNRNLPNISPDPNQEAQLIQSGVYTRVRHPIYTGVLMGASGVALFHGHPALIGITLVFWLFFTYKSMHEDRLLSSVYPAYKNYMKRTGRFLPF